MPEHALATARAFAGARELAIERPRIGVVGKASHEGVMVGRAFELLDADVVYVDPWDDEGPEELLDQRPDLVLLSLEWVAKHRLVSAAAGRAGIPVVYVVDGVIEWSYVWNNHGFIRPNGTFLQPLIASDLSVVGRHQARILASWGLADRIRLVGLPRLDDVQRGAGPTFPPSLPAPTSARLDVALAEREVGRSGAVQLSSGAAGRPKLLVATATTYGHDEEHKVMVRRSISDLAEWFRINDFVEPVWRIHPDLAEDFGLTASRDGTAVDAIAACAGVISTPSTVILEGMRVGVPVAQIEYRSVPLYLQTAWEIRGRDHIGSVIHDMLHPPTQRLAHQDFCLDDELEAGNASARLADVMRAAIARRTAGSVVSGFSRTLIEPAASADPESVAPGRLDFRQVHSQLSAFSASPISLVQYELDATGQALERLRAKCRALDADRGALTSERSTLWAERDGLHARIAHLEAECRSLDQLRDESQRVHDDVVRVHNDTVRTHEEIVRVHADARRAHEAVERQWRERYMEAGRNKLVRVIDRLVSEGARKVVIYGAGEVGAMALSACETLGLDVVGVADSNHERWGKRVNGLTIEAPTAVLARRCDAVIVGSFASFRAIRRNVRLMLRGRRSRASVVGVHHVW